MTDSTTSFSMFRKQTSVAMGWKISTARQPSQLFVHERCLLTCKMCQLPRESCIVNILESAQSHESLVLRVDFKSCEKTSHLSTFNLIYWAILNWRNGFIGEQSAYPTLCSVSGQCETARKTNTLSHFWLLLCKESSNQHSTINLKQNLQVFGLLLSNSNK